jgi:hypothetical protein
MMVLFPNIVSKNTRSKTTRHLLSFLGVVRSSEWRFGYENGSISYVYETEVGYDGEKSSCIAQTLESDWEVPYTFAEYISLGKIAPTPAYAPLDAYRLNYTSDSTV